MPNDTSPLAAHPAKCWPYPRWIAHRGAGRLAPENTLAALRLGAQHGYRMAECDAQLSADGVVFLLHDETLERTTNGQGAAGAQPWAALQRLDAGSWHGPSFTGEPLPTLEALAAWCHAHAFWLNIEIKPAPGREAQTGQAVAQEAARLWAGAAVPPLLTSFDPPALVAAQAAAPQLLRGLLLHTLWPGWLRTAQALGCVAVVAEQTLWDAALMATVRSAGLRALAYTVNDAAAAQRLLALGLDGLITDRVDFFRPG